MYVSWSRVPAGVRVPGLVLVLVLVFTACDDPAADGGTDGGVEDLTIVVEADKSRILEEEKSLQVKRNAVREEQERLNQQQDAIEEKLANISKLDKKQRAQLEAEQKRIAEEAQRIRDNARRFEQEREELAKEKNQLLDRITKLTGTGKGGRSIAEREEIVAQRERALAARETEVAKREKDVAAREATAAERLEAAATILADLRAGGGIGKTVVVTQAPSGTAPATRAQAQRARKDVDGKLEAKGVLMEDLGSQGQDLMRSAQAAYQNKDYSSAVELWTQLGATVEAVNVNRDFVKGKFDRLNRDYPTQKNDERVQTLLQEAGSFFNDGRYSRANKKINQIIAILEKK